MAGFSDSNVSTLSGTVHDDSQSTVDPPQKTIEINGEVFTIPELPPPMHTRRPLLALSIEHKVIEIKKFRNYRHYIDELTRNNWLAGSSSEAKLCSPRAIWPKEFAICTLCNFIISKLPSAQAIHCESQRHVTLLSSFLGQQLQFPGTRCPKCGDLVHQRRVASHACAKPTNGSQDHVNIEDATEEPPRKIRKTSVAPADENSASPLEAEEKSGIANESVVAQAANPSNDLHIASFDVLFSEHGRAPIVQVSSPQPPAQVLVGNAPVIQDAQLLAEMDSFLAEVATAPDQLLAYSEQAVDLDSLFSFEASPLPDPPTTEEWNAISIYFDNLLESTCIADTASSGSIDLTVF